jgi:hypothetical protein
MYEEEVEETIIATVVNLQSCMDEMMPTGKEVKGKWKTITPMRLHSIQDIYLINHL